MSELITPTGVLVTNAEPETPEWFAARREGITGTDLPKILGLTKYGNALSVWLDKRGELKDEAGEAATWGQILEDPVAQEWARRHFTTVERVGVLANAGTPWLRASLDRLVITCPDDNSGLLVDSHQCGLEIKTRSAFVATEWRDGMPDSVLAQVAWGRLVSGLGHMHVAALIGGQRLVSFRYDPDERLEEYLIEKAAPIWEAVQQGTPPEVDPDADGVLLDLLDQMYAARAGDREIEAEAAERWLNQYAEGNDLEREGKRLKTQAKTGLVQLLDDGERGLVDDVVRFTYTAGEPGDTVTAADLRDYAARRPSVYAALRAAGLITKTNPGRTFRVKSIKEKS